MAFSRSLKACYPWQLPVQLRCSALFLLVALLTACSATPTVDSSTVSRLAPLQLDGRQLPPTAGAASTPDLLAVDESMREFVAHYTRDAATDRQRLMALHRAIIGAGAMHLEYDPLADGSAREVFYRGTANCLSYASLFVALAREAGLDARYQWVDVRPQWSRAGDRVQVGLHVNVVVKLDRGGRYMVDIDPLPSRDIAASMDLSDRDARALYHNNIAMAALSRGDLERAWGHTVRALQFNPQMAHLWLNLGAVYRSAGQHREAERSYLQALELDPWLHSAMTNLVFLYELEGRAEEREYWADQVHRYQQTNPYYYAWLGEEAERAGDWRAALEHYDRAVHLSPGDASLLYARGMAHYQCGELTAAMRDIERARDLATLRSDIEAYRLQLERLRREQVVGI